MSLGLPYKGSKSSIAKWIIDQLPPARTFVDLFAGGCAVTHAAILSGKYEHFVVNDIIGTPIVFRDAVRGEYNGLSTVLSRADFFETEDIALRLLYSFGNDNATFLWGVCEPLKISASKMLTAPSLHERRMHYRNFIKELARYVDSVVEGAEPKKHIDKVQSAEGLERLERLQNLERVERLQNLERVERLQNLERLERLQNLERLERLHIMVSDYRCVNLPADAVVYADPPYRKTGEHYGGFDFEAFDRWLGAVDHQVYVSEYDAPAGCVCIAERERFDHMAAFGASKKVERLFTQERYGGRVR